MIRAALHVHSTWSDGEFSLAELRDLFHGAGCRLLAVVDHAANFDVARARRFREACAELSNRDMLMFPSFEFDCDERVHVIGYGVTEPCASADPATVVQHIHDAGGVAVLAHPRTEQFERLAQWAGLLDGIEVWNTKYDGRYGPRRETFEWLSDLRRQHPLLWGHFGLDLHWRAQFRELRTHLDLEPGHLSPQTVLKALREGRFAGVLGELELPADGGIGEDLLGRFARAQQRSRRVRSSLNTLGKLVTALGLKPPAALKAQLRRLF